MNIRDSLERDFETYYTKKSKMIPQILKTLKAPKTPKIPKTPPNNYQEETQ